MIIPHSFEDCKNQDQMVLYHIGRYGSITQRDADDRYGITRLAAVIDRLENKHGFEFKHAYESGKNRFGKKVPYVRYSFRWEV